MIVSASYRTDIPAFYGHWFRRRLADGMAEVVNPYGGQVHRVALTREAVDAGIAAAADALTPTIARGWVRHCGYTV